MEASNFGTGYTLLGCPVIVNSYVGQDTGKVTIVTLIASVSDPDSDGARIAIKDALLREMTFFWCENVRRRNIRIYFYRVGVLGYYLIDKIIQLIYNKKALI